MENISGYILDSETDTRITRISVAALIADAMIMFQLATVIIQVVQRGRCEVQGCDCARYMSMSNSRLQSGDTDCQYCKHSPSRHMNLRQQSQAQTSTGNELQSSKVTPKKPEPIPSIFQPHKAKGCVSSLPIQTWKVKSQGMYIII